MARRWIFAAIVVLPACTQLLGAHDPIELFADAAAPRDATIDVAAEDAVAEDATDAFAAEDRIALDTGLLPDTATAGDASRQCPPGYHDCGGACVEYTNVNACGPSCTPCPGPMPSGQTTCDGATCGIACPGSLSPCYLPAPLCLDLATDPNNCGMCGRSCDGGACAAGDCVDAG